jgi:RNA polymerase sigma factor (sigma-70 family)
MDDKALLQKIGESDPSAVGILVENNKNLVWHIIISMTGRNCDSEDLFQEVFFQVFKGLKRFRADARLSTWIGSIAHHVCVDYLRKKKKTDSYVDIDNELKPHIGLSQDADWKQTENENLNQVLYAAIAKLPAQYRKVITLYHLDEKSYGEIAAITGMPEGTVKSYISRGRNQLRESLIMLVPDLPEILND